MEVSPETLSLLSDMIIVVTFFIVVASAWGYFILEFVSLVADKITAAIKKQKEKKETDENPNIEYRP